MVILAPWKPVAIVLSFLSALIFVSYFGPALVRGKDPFVVSTANRQPATAHGATSQSTGAHKPSSSP
jgi:hypothetical protein